MISIGWVGGHRLIQTHSLWVWELISVVGSRLYILLWLLLTFIWRYIEEEEGERKRGGGGISASALNFAASFQKWAINCWCPKHVGCVAPSGGWSWLLFLGCACVPVCTYDRLVYMNYDVGAVVLCSIMGKVADFVSVYKNPACVLNLSSFILVSPPPSLCSFVFSAT